VANPYADNVRAAARPVDGAGADYDELVDALGQTRVVLLGEASHGSQEFYRERARITQRLISEYGFTAVCIEGDWPDSQRVDRYVRGRSEDAGAVEALGGFRRFPAWMWRNREASDLVAWLRSYNDERSSEAQAGFYGLDLYSLHTSLEAVLGYLWTRDGEAHARARRRYACFDQVRDPVEYAYEVGYGLGQSCEDEAVAELVELSRQRDPKDSELFSAIENARLVVDAERYYRLMFQSDVSSWNLRDKHMFDTLVAIDAHLSAVAPARLIVWAHNSHVGDARATEMGERGEWNIGQLAREHYGDEVTTVGFTTYSGTVTAASDWGGAEELKRVRPALEQSYEAFFHAVGPERFWLPLSAGLVPERLLERAIGVIYRPETERQSHYFEAQLAAQFDYLVHLDRTHAVQPLDPGESWQGGEVPETYPSAL
jgi:erythromycin esterase-like protein